MRGGMAAGWGVRAMLAAAGLAIGLAMDAAAGPHDLVARTVDQPGFVYHPSPADWRDVNMYQLFTDRFFDGNAGNNLARSATTGAPWYNQTGSNAENDRHLYQGGDWAGIKQKLGYLKDMGVNAIWISGVQLNEQGFDKRFTPYHAYHPSDFYRCEPMFGTFAELKDLIDTAHQNGIYVILDVVVNHTADLLKYTDCNCNYEGYCENNCAALDWWDPAVRVAAPFDSPQWFHNHGTIGDNDWDTYPRYIRGAFLGTEDLRTDDPYVQGALRDIFKHLIDATDCDGFRVDAIKHMEYDFIKGWADDMRRHAAARGKSDFLLFGEYFSYDDNVQASYCRDPGYSFNSTLWFPMQLTIKNVFAYEQGTVQLAQRLNALNLYGEAATRIVAFVDNHDVDRIALECGSQWEAKLRPALTFLYTAMPVPCLYYGTEHGFNQGERRNGSPKLGLADFQRETMWNFGFQWGNAYGDKFVQSPLYLHIKALNALRQQYISLRRGSLVERWSEGGKGLFAYSRIHGAEEALVAINTDWGAKSLNPLVGQPEGTVFRNALNPAETVTVSGGRLAFTVDAKGSKIFVAAPASAVVATACTPTTLTITYTPQAGPLAAPAGAIHAGIDGGLGIIDAVMTLSGGIWSAHYALSNAGDSVTFWFHDEAQPPTYDNNNGQNWVLDVTGCGLPGEDLAWIGNAAHWPPDGEWDPGESLWVNIESYPRSAAIAGEVVFSNDGGANWDSAPLAINGAIGNNDAWHANLGPRPGGASVQYAVRLSGRNGDLWDNNGGADFLATVNAGASTVLWIGNTAHWPANGTIEPDNDIWINVESFPIGAAMAGEVVYSNDGGATWQGAAMQHQGVSGNNDWWNCNLGAFAPETTLRYAVRVRDGDGTDHWDNNGGSNFVAVINPAASSVRWLGNATRGGAHPPVLTLEQDAITGQLYVTLDGLAVPGQYTLLASRDLVTFTNLTTLTPQDETEAVPLPEDGAADTGFYRVQLDWVSAPTVFADQHTVISIETWPIGGAREANLVFSLDGGQTWQTAAMTHTGTRGNNDIWSVSLGMLPAGTVVRYAVEIRDERGESRWDNNAGQDHIFTVRDPDQVDFSPPATGYSPSDTVTASPTLTITLTATDDLDPTPMIHYTTDGTAPTPSSPVYATPILVTDQGDGVDMTIRFFAVDASGNASGITTLEVRVNHNPTFGGSKPYSTNPSLGQRVANGAITIDGVNNGEWTAAHVIALDMANDDPRSLGANWTMHEGAIDLTHAWAAWDDDYLYLAWQYVDVTDRIDPANAGSSGGGKISNNDGILQWLMLDTIPGSAGATNDMWQKRQTWAGPNRPDYQIYLAGSLWQGYISRAQGGVFPVDDGGANYRAVAAAGITVAKGDRFAAGELWGVGDADDRFAAGAPAREFMAEGHSGARDSFYEMRIPLAYLNLTASDLETTGIGVMIGAGSTSAMDTIPNDPATSDSPGIEAWNSSFEWSDEDRFTVPFARIGAGL